MLNIGKTIFYRAPALIKNLLISSYGFIEKRKRNGNYFVEHYRDLNATRQAGIEGIEKYQIDRLRELLIEACEYSPWYKQAFHGAGISKESFRSEPPLELLSQLPFLEKTELRERTFEVMSMNPARSSFAKVSTSGTTGSPMEIVFDKEGRQATFAEWRCYYDWLGLPQEFRSARFSGRIIVKPGALHKPFWVHNWADKQLFMSAYHLKESNLNTYVEKLNSFKPVLIDGYPSAIYVIARYIVNNEIKLAFKPIAVSTTAETLLDHQRDVIEQAFKCKVYNQYASSEGAPWIVECQQGNYHLWLDTGVFEFINKKPLDDETDIAELVVTSFRNFKTPLIRYRIGDYVQLFKQEPNCTCSAPYPVIKGIIGRDDDILFTDEKGWVGRMDPAYKGVRGITQSKLIQHTAEELEVLLVTDDGFDKTQQDLFLKNLRERLGQNLKITLNKLDHIPLGKSGKLKSVERRFSIEGDTHK